MTMSLEIGDSPEIASSFAAVAVVEKPPPPHPPPTATTMVVEGSGRSPSSPRPGSSRRGSVRSIRSVSSSRPGGSRRGSGVSGISANSRSGNSRSRRESFHKRGSFLHLENTVADRTRHLLESLAHFSSSQGSTSFRRMSGGDGRKKSDGGGNKGKKKEVKELEHGDVEVGKLVGKGGFSHVYELKAVRRRSFLNSLTSFDDDDCDDGADAEHRTDDGSSTTMSSSELIAKNFVVKHLNALVLCSEEEDGGDRYRAAAADLAFEAKLLSSISHPNIVRLRGVTRGCEISALYAGGKLMQQKQPEGGAGAGGDGGFGGGYFIVLDKLECTLTERIEEWSREKKALKKKKSNSKAVGKWARKRSSMILRRASSTICGPGDDDDDEQQPSGWKVGRRRSSAILRRRSSSIEDRDDDDEQPSSWKVGRQSSAILRHRQSSSSCEDNEDEQQPSGWKVGSRHSSAKLRHRRSSSMGDREDKDKDDGDQPTKHGQGTPTRTPRRRGRRSSLGAMFRRGSTFLSSDDDDAEAGSGSGSGSGSNDDDDEKELVQSNHSARSGHTAATSSSSRTTLPSDRKDNNKRSDRKRDFVRRRLDVALQIARAMKYIHSRGIMYRDLKPENVGFDSSSVSTGGDTVIKIFDFGLARFLPKADDRGRRKRPTGIAGTPRYMAPEVARCQHYGLEADVYSFGLLLWEILALERPFGDKISPKELQEKVVYGNKRPKVDRRKNGGWPIAVCDLMEMCWNAEPGERPGFGRILDVLDREVDALSM